MEPDTEAQAVTLQAWEVVYWSVFGLSWVLIPLLQEYEDSGEFSACDRIKSGFFQFIKPAVVVLVIGTAFIIYISINRIITK